MGAWLARADRSTRCDRAPMSQPFAPWGDPSWYTLVQNGGFEQGGSSWTLAGDATAAAGNETFMVTDPGDASSLNLGATGKATTDPMCVTPADPTLRLFVRNAGDPGSVPQGSVR